LTDKLEPAGRLVGQKLSGGKAPLPNLAEGRASGLFQRIADGAPSSPKRLLGGRTATRPQGGGKRLDARPSKDGAAGGLQDTGSATSTRSSAL